MTANVGGMFQFPFCFFTLSFSINKMGGGGGGGHIINCFLFSLKLESNVLCGNVYQILKNTLGDQFLLWILHFSSH